VVDVERAGELHRAVEVERLRRPVVDERARHIAVLEPLIERNLLAVLDGVRAVEELDRPIAVERAEAGDA
jgi:hypothetical protein